MAEEIKNRFNISKITIRNVFLVALLTAVLMIIGIAFKLIGSNATKTNIAQAQSGCWVVPPAGGEGGGGCEATAGSSESSGACCCGSSDCCG